MNNHSIRQGILLAVILTITATGRSQIYTLTTPVTGSAELSLSYSQPPGPLVRIFDRADFGTLTETIYFDPLNLTVRQIGSVSVTYLVQTNTRTLSQVIGGQTVTGQLITGQALTGGAVSFDTGVVPLVWDDQIHAFRKAINGHPPLIGNIPVSGSFSLNTGGQTYAGDFNYSIRDDFQVFSVFATNSNPALLSMRGFGGSTFGNQQAGFYFSDHPGGLTNFTAGNGLVLSLFTGASDATDFLTWSAGPVNATVVPEPVALPFVGLAAVGWAFVRRRR